MKVLRTILSGLGPTLLMVAVAVLATALIIGPVLLSASVLDDGGEAGMWALGVEFLLLVSYAAGKERQR